MVFTLTIFLSVGNMAMQFFRAIKLAHYEKPSHFDLQYTRNGEENRIRFSEKFRTLHGKG